MAKKFQTMILDGVTSQKYLHDIAHLRITVFKDFPYLYDGDLSYEEKYLNTYFKSQDARVVICLHDQEVIGASTLIPLKGAPDIFKEPFIKKGIDPNSIIYFGESVLLKKYRGQGIGKIFFEERLKYANDIPQIKKATFCAVIRDDQDPFRPIGYRPLDPFWKAQGFVKVSGLTCFISWKQTDEEFETPKEMQFWVKDL